MGSREHAIGAHIVTLAVGGERFDGVATVRHETEQPFHPLGIALQRAYLRQRLGLRRKTRVGRAVGPANLPALAVLAGVEEPLSDRCDISHLRCLPSKLRSLPGAPGGTAGCTSLTRPIVVAAITCSDASAGSAALEALDLL